MSTELGVEILEEFDRLGEVVDTHDLLCLCADCGRFMELGDLIRAQRAEQKAAGVSR
jgi:hypothetical protein